MSGIVPEISNWYLLCFLLSVSVERTLVDRAGPGQVWAVLVAGSRGWDNYRHQADVCHAYQVIYLESYI